MGNASSLQQQQQNDAKDAFENHDILKFYRLEGQFTGSGRMIRTFSIRHLAVESTGVVKTLWIDENDDNIEKHRQELIRIKQAVQGQSHVAPFLAWFLGNANARLQTSLRPVFLLRTHVYTTLSDRLASRPWLHSIEKVWIVSQLLQALHHLHASNVVHGFLTTENIGLTSSGWVVLLDISSYKPLTALPDNDPSLYLHYFQQQQQQQQDSKRSAGEKRCYLAPERFYTPPTTKTCGDDLPLTPAMDLFSAGCVITEALGLEGGESCLDLGQLMEYRRAGQVTPTLTQKLSKIESSALRAACRHMLNLNPKERLSAKDYLERLKAANQLPTCLDTLTDLVERVTASTTSPDARLAIAASQYKLILWETVGKRDEDGWNYLQTILGPALLEREGLVGATQKESPQAPSSKPTLQPTSGNSSTDRLFAETEELLKQLDSLTLDDDVEVDDQPTQPTPEHDDENFVALEPQIASRSRLSKSCLLIYLQLICSLVRSVQRPASKLVALQLLKQLAARMANDDARLQRVVPCCVSLLMDQDPLVRASALRVLTFTLSIVQSFPPSDSKVFPQYIFKRVAHMISDQSLVVRLAFAECMPILAETAHRFLDISHAVRLYEAVGSGSGAGGTATPSAPDGADSKKETVFGDEVARLLDPATTTAEASAPASSDSTKTDATSPFAAAAGKTLICSTYQSELGGLQETVARWVMHIAMDQGENSAIPKRALLADIGRLCAFFGLEGVMSSILPHLLAFLNDRKNWELRSALFASLPPVCRIIGRAASEEFVVPCVEIGLVDSEYEVIRSALSCFSRLIDLGLLSRSYLLGGLDSSGIGESSSAKPSNSILARRALLVHPSDNIRCEAIQTFAKSCEAVGSPDCDIYLSPFLQPLMRFDHPPLSTLMSASGLTRCLQPAWSDAMFSELLERCADSIRQADSTEGVWTSIGIQLRENSNSPKRKNKTATGVGNPDDDGQRSVFLSGGDDAAAVPTPQVECVLEYVRMLVKQAGGKSPVAREIQKNLLSAGIEGSSKLAQSIMFPRQDSPAQKAFVPDWYNSLRDTAAHSDVSTEVSESAAIRSVSTLGHVYGLSIMVGPSAGTSENIVGAADDSVGGSAGEAAKEEGAADAVLYQPESKTLEASYAGQWGSEAAVDPDLVDTSLLLTKLKALNVPTLPPKLGELLPGVQSPLRGSSVRDPGGGQGSDGGSTSNWKPRLNAFIASSVAASPARGHTAAVSQLAVSMDNSFFVSASHDGTCRVWETSQLEHSTGVLESSVVYKGHSGGGQNDSAARVNDIAQIERSHSVASGDSNGIVKVWRVDTVASSSPSAGTTTGGGDLSSRDNIRSRAVGSSEMRQVAIKEGEIMSVSHFNSSSASVIAFATQNGTVHSWDLRSATEPFVLKHGSELGHLTSIAMGSSDRHWMVSGTNKGYLALWDIRFQRGAAKLWRHSRRAPINKLATSTIFPQQNWAKSATQQQLPQQAEARPFIFAATGPNECAMFDAISGACRQCFRTVAGELQPSSAGGTHVEDPPSLEEIAFQITKRGIFPNVKHAASEKYSVTTNSINCMTGSIGGGGYLITGGSDCKIRYWDFSLPSKCYVVATTGTPHLHPRPSYERIDFDGPLRVMLCRQPRTHTVNKTLAQFHGPRKPDLFHSDAILDVKVLDNSALLSCSRDSTIKVFR